MLKKIICKLANKALYFFRCIGWYKFFLSECANTEIRDICVDEEWYKEGSVLLIAPHADDELLSSYTLLKRCPSITVYYCGFTGTNNVKINQQRRRDEIEGVCKLLNVPIIDGEGKCENILEVIRDFNVVVLPSIVDWHEEHRKINYIVYDALKKSMHKPLLYSYSVSVPNNSTMQVFANSICKNEQDDKYLIFSNIYNTQNFMPKYRFRVNERINGLYLGSYAAEFFMHHPLDQWNRKIQRIKDLEEKKDDSLFALIKAVSNINNLGKVREASRRFYNFVELEL